MKFLILIGGGRAGIDLFQSLLDNHPQISQFPGVFNWHDFYSKIKNSNKPEQIYKEFIKRYSMFFDSRKNKLERHDKLGNKKNEFYFIDKKIFVKKFLDLLAKKEINKKNILIALHLAYSYSSGQNLKSKKIIAINLHTEENIRCLKGLNYKTLYTIREPLVSLSSGFKHWLAYKKGAHVTAWSIFFHIDRQFNSLKKISKKDKSAFVIKLEKLHKNSEFTMRKFCKEINIKFEYSLLKSTYHKKKWWGDSLSKKYLNGLNKKFKNKLYPDIFFNNDLHLFRFFLSPIYQKYYNSKLIKKKINNNFIKFYPLKIEYLIFKRMLKKKSFIGLISCFYYYFKRINLMKENHFKKVKLPKILNK